MATNRIYRTGNRLTVAVPVDTGAGEPVAFGELPGVTLTDRDADGNATIQTDGVYELEVTGEDGEGEAAISAGDIVYYAEGGLSGDDAGVRFGYALEGVASGATAIVPVKVGY